MATSFAVVGDLNADSLDDIIALIFNSDMSSPFYKNWIRSYVNWDSTVTSPVDFIFSNENKYYTTAASAGDLDRDGVFDIIFSSPNENRVSIRSGKTRALLAQFDGPEKSLYGSSIILCPDLNSDGYDDYIISAPEEFIGGYSTGRVYIVSGKSGENLFVLSGTQNFEQFGLSVETINDINLDGIAEFVVGSPKFDGPNGADSGKVTIFSGANGNVIQTLLGSTLGESFGTKLATMQDIDYDDKQELAISAPDFKIDAETTGRLDVFSMSTFLKQYSINSPTDTTGFISTMISSPDFTKDGIDDLIGYAGNSSRNYLIDARTGTVIKEFYMNGYGHTFK